MSDWIEGEIVRNIHWHENLFSLKISADIGDFRAGQFTSLALEIEGERIARPYSFLSSPGQQPLEFFFYVATDGVLSNALVALQEGDKVLVKKPANGFFTLDEVPQSRDLWMLGTGTGVAPYFSILGCDEVWQRFENVVLVQGVRTAKDLCYQDLVEQHLEEHPQAFHFQAFVSREDYPGSIRGRIPQNIKSRELESRLDLQLNPENSQIMLCGNPEMVKDCVTLLKERNFAKNLRRKPGHITTEKYW